MGKFIEMALKKVCLTLICSVVGMILGVILGFAFAFVYGLVVVATHPNDPSASSGEFVLSLLTVPLGGLLGIAAGLALAIKLFWFRNHEK